MDTQLQFTLVSTDDEIRQILALQQANRPENLTPEDLRREGFVTVVHTFDLLKSMCLAAPTVIAKDGDRVVGYNVVMLRDFSDRIPVLFSLFEQLETIDFKGKRLADYDFVCCGQVCVAEGYRGQKVFDRLCEKYREAYAGRYEVMLTDISSRNPRSLRAHQRVGFEVVKTFQAEDGEVWDIVVWDWRRVESGGF